MSTGTTARTRTGVVAVVGGKGGVGVTTVAYNLAFALDAVAVDADLGMADLAVPRGPDLQTVLCGRADPVEAVDESGSVAVLPCGRSLAAARALDVRGLVDALAAVERHYGRVVVDCPTGVGPATGLGLLSADAVVLVTTPDEVAVRDARRVRGLARTLDAGLAAVAVNRSTAARGTKGHGPAAAVDLGGPVVAIPESDALARSWRHGQPVAAAGNDAADGPTAAAIAELARAAHGGLRVPR